MPTSRPQLSLCMIVRDEEEMLPGCLASVEGIVDEVVIVDTGSEDRTMAIAAEAGATVVERPWDDDFAAPRNRALEASTGDWILVLDADERLGPGAGEVILAAIAGGDFDCGMLPLHNASAVDADPAEVVAGKARLTDVAYLPRLLRRTDDLRWQGIIHESVGAWLAKGRRATFVPGADIVHLGGVPDVRERRNKAQRNVSMLERACARDPEDVTPYGYLAHELLEAGAREQAAEIAARGWSLLEGGHTTDDLAALRLATARAWTLIQGGDADGALGTVEHALSLSPRHPDLYFLRGCAHEILALRADDLEVRRSRLVLALDAYVAAHARDDEVILQKFVQGGTSWAALVRIGTIHLLAEQPDRALDAFMRASDLNPESREAVLGRIEAMVALGQATEAMKAVQAVLDERPDGWVLAALGAEAAGMDDSMEKLLLRAQQSLANATFLAPHRRERYEDAMAILSIRRDRPAAGPGPWGQLAALMVERYEATPRGALRSLDPQALARVLEITLRKGRLNRLVPLLQPQASELLPGIGDAVHAMVTRFGQTLSASS